MQRKVLHLSGAQFAWIQGGPKCHCCLKWNLPALISHHDLILYHIYDNNMLYTLYIIVVISWGLTSENICKMVEVISWHSHNSACEPNRSIVFFYIYGWWLVCVCYVMVGVGGGGGVVCLIFCWWSKWTGTCSWCVHDVWLWSLKWPLSLSLSLSLSYI